MKLDLAETKALVLMEEHGLLKEGWKFKFDKAKMRFGLCSYKKKTISLSKAIVELNDEEHVVDTILHEIAHALVGAKHGHNKVWKRKALEIGCNGERCYSTKLITQPETKYTLICPECDAEYPRQRWPKRNVACTDCCIKYNGGRYHEKYCLIVRDNGLN